MLISAKNCWKLGRRSWLSTPLETHTGETAAMAPEKTVLGFCSRKFARNLSRNRPNRVRVKKRVPDLILEQVLNHPIGKIQRLFLMDHLRRLEAVCLFFSKACLFLPSISSSLSSISLARMGTIQTSSLLALAILFILSASTASSPRVIMVFTNQEFPLLAPVYSSLFSFFEVSSYMSAPSSLWGSGVAFLCRGFPNKGQFFFDPQKSIFSVFLPSIFLSSLLTRSSFIIVCSTGLSSFSTSSFFSRTVEGDSFLFQNKFGQPNDFFASNAPKEVSLLVFTRGLDSDSFASSCGSISLLGYLLPSFSFLLFLSKLKFGLKLNFLPSRKLPSFFFSDLSFPPFSSLWEPDCDLSSSFCITLRGFQGCFYFLQEKEDLNFSQAVFWMVGKSDVTLRSRAKSLQSSSSSI